MSTHKPNKNTDSNQKRVKRYLDYVALAPCIVMEGISSRAQWILDNQNDIITKKDSFLNPELYVQAARDWFDMNPEYKKK